MQELKSKSDELKISLVVKYCLFTFEKACVTIFEIMQKNNVEMHLISS